MATCEKKLVKRKSGLKIVPVNDTLQSPFFIKEPSWIPDKEVLCRCFTVTVPMYNEWMHSV